MKGQLVTCIREVIRNERIFYRWFDIRRYKVKKRAWVNASLTEFGIGGVCPRSWAFKLNNDLYIPWLKERMEKNYENTSVLISSNTLSYSKHSQQKLLQSFKMFIENPSKMLL